jgi:hypothetical protein
MIVSCMHSTKYSGDLRASSIGISTFSMILDVFYHFRVISVYRRLIRKLLLGNGWLFVMDMAMDSVELMYR